MATIVPWLTDRLIMMPSRHRVATAGKRRRTVPFEQGELEIWTQQVGVHNHRPADIFVLKFSGTGGRAERSTEHPMDYWTDLAAEIWSVNPPGYGGSSGRASVRSLAASGRTAYSALAKHAEGRPIVVMGNSLGTATAMHLAAEYAIAGLIIRNPPPLRELIIRRYGWWNLWFGAWLIAQQVPRELCAKRNACRVQCPAVIVSSCRDRTVPVAYQEMIFQAYRGEFRLLRLKHADHATPLTLGEQQEYAAHLNWLRQEMLSSPAARSAAPRLAGRQADAH